MAGERNNDSNNRVKLSQVEIKPVLYLILKAHLVLELNCFIQTAPGGIIGVSSTEMNFFFPHGCLNLHNFSLLFIFYLLTTTLT